MEYGRAEGWLETRAELQDCRTGLERMIGWAAGPEGQCATSEKELQGGAMVTTDQGKSRGSSDPAGHKGLVD